MFYTDRKMGKRNESLDIITGIMILWMIVYHSFQWANYYDSNVFNLLLKCFYFFIPWFYFKSGFVFNKTHTLKIVVEKGISQLLIPMILWTLIGYALTIHELINDGIPIWKIIIRPAFILLRYGDTLGNAPLWFLLSLFLVRISMKLLANLKLGLIIAFAISFALLGYLFNCKNFNVPLGLINYPIGMFFFLTGFVCNQLKMKQNMSKMNIVLIACTGLISMFFFSYVDFHLNITWHGNYWVYIIGSLLAINSLLVLFKNIRIKSLAWIGNKSLYFFVIHWPVFYIIQYIFKSIDLPLKSYFFCLTLSFGAIFLSSLIAKLIPEKYIGLDGSGIFERGKLLFRRTNKPV